MPIKNFNTNEYSSWILSQGSPHNCIIVAGVSEDIEIDRLKKSVQLASSEQEMLQYSISRDVCGFIKINEAMPVSETHDQNWQTVAETELAKNFSDNGVLARIILLKNKNIQYIVLCFHHIVGDGISGIHFLLRILHFYCDLDASSSPNFKNLLRDFTIPEPNSRLAEGYAFNPSAVTKIQSIKIDLAAVKRIENMAKISGFSLNAYLYANILQVASDVFDTNYFNVSIPVDLRVKKNNPIIFPLKFHTSWIDFQWKKAISENTLETVQFLQSQMRSDFRKKQYISNLNILTEQINKRENNFNFSKSFISKEPTICISNAGAIDTIMRDRNIILPFQLVELHLSVNAQAYMGTHDSFTVQLSQLKNYGQFININYPSSLINEQKISYFLDRIKEKLSQ